MSNLPAGNFSLRPPAEVFSQVTAPPVPSLPFSFSGVEREGGYAEEFVWVQRES